MEFNSTMTFLERTYSFLSTLSSDPLFSSIVTLYTLILLYFPRLFLGIVFSPVLISTGILFLSLPRLGLIQTTEKEFNSTDAQQTHDSSTEEDHKWVSRETSLGLDLNPNPFYADSFVEWNLRAPLEVIYEEYEGEDEEGEGNDDVPVEKGERRETGIERYPSLSLYYPESDSDDSSDGDFPVIGGWDSPESMGFRWEEDGGDGLIEIALDGKRTSEVEEENLIEIDISTARDDEFRREFD
ncbi:uncharacterized protein LOC132306394 [Cornus florida]|uniref:uncharacterized protein LOC132306394 n=1 Tax=Cornus florida TaxID=4283 RepID=UPI00289E1E44|nr:uncharacterized protein LOC132306394 [Cornus florida]